MGERRKISAIGDALSSIGKVFGMSSHSLGKKSGETTLFQSMVGSEEEDTAPPSLIPLTVYPDNSYAIHPAIGIARVGNTEDYFLGPEKISEPINSETGSVKLKPDTDNINRQGARFRVFKYINGAPKEVKVGEDGVISIQWTVHIANKKGAWHEFKSIDGERTSNKNRKRNHNVEKFIIDPGPRSITIDAGNQKPIEKFSLNNTPAGYNARWPDKLNNGNRPAGDKINYLGEIQGSEEGRLVVLGGHGHAGNITNSGGIVGYANNPGWIDDTADGYVKATIKVQSGTTVKTIENVTPAWIIVAPPDYAPEIGNVVSLFDTVHDLFTRCSPGYNPAAYDVANKKFKLEAAGYKPNYERDILPCIKSGAQSAWTLKPTNDWLFHGSLNGANVNSFFDRLTETPLSNTSDILQSLKSRPAESDPENMPKLWGDLGITSCLLLPRTLYYNFKQASDGYLDESSPPPLSPAEELDRAALMNGSGGAFFPGIETGWMIRNPKIWASTFRIQHRRTAGVDPAKGVDPDGDELHDVTGCEPGDLTKRMAVPWHADFLKCAGESSSGYAWWPGQRPVHVVPESKISTSMGKMGTVMEKWARGMEMWVSGSLRLDHEKLIDKWAKLGYLKDKGTATVPKYVEIKRGSI